MKFPVKDSDVKGKIMDFIEFFGMGTLASFHIPIEFGTSGKKHIEDNTSPPPDFFPESTLLDLSPLL